MPMEPALRALLVQTLLIAPYVSRDHYGKPTYGPAVAVPGRIERHFITAASTTGAQLLDETKAFIDGSAIIDEQSQVTMPDGQVLPIEGLKPVLAIDGSIHHWEIFF